MSLDILERIDDRLHRIEAELALVRGEVKRLAQRMASEECPRCLVQIGEAPTEPPP